MDEHSLGRFNHGDWHYLLHFHSPSRPRTPGLPGKPLGPVSPIIPSSPGLPANT